MKISIIVPLYNAASTIRRCVDSILLQTFTDFELILVDDGSKDGSLAICEEYALVDSRVKVIHKENGGVSSARNAGLDVAQGKWVCFVDSDDYIDWIAYSTEDTDSHADAVIYALSINGNPIYPDPGISDDISPHLNNVLLKSACAKLLRRETIGSLRFDSHLRIGEDSLFMLSFLSRCHQCKVSHSVFYYYSQAQALTDKYKLKIGEAIYALSAFQSVYEHSNLSNSMYMKWVFLDYKKYCQGEIFRKPNDWYFNETVKKYYKKYKSTMGLRHRISYMLRYFQSFLYV